MKKVNRTRPYTWSIRLSAQELHDVQERVKVSGKTMRDFALHALLSIPIIDYRGIFSVLPELRRIGNNLNQLTRRCNQGDQLTYHEVTAMRRELSEIWRLLRSLVEEHR